MKQIKILGVPLHNLSREDLKDQFRKILSGDKFSQVATVNPEFLVYGKTHPEFQNLLNKTALNICDGIGISLLSKLLYRQNITRITGVEVSEILCEICAEMKKPIYFFGGFEGVSQKASHSIKQKYPNLIIAGTCEGNENTLEEIKRKSPVAILVALGSPKQENWLREKAPLVPSLRIGIGVGGTFDFWSGKVKRAPVLLQNTGLEWFYRLITQPYRWKRIFKALFVFPWYVMKEKIKGVNQEL